MAAILDIITLAILDLHVALMHPTKFQLNPTRFLRFRLENFKMAVMLAILDIRRAF